MNVHAIKFRLLATAALAFLALPTAEAGQRRFAYSYETLTAPVGSLEFENHVTFKRSPLHDGNLNSWEFRHEIEYGVTSRFQLAVYVANWDFAPRDGEKIRRSARYGSSGVELIYNLTNPNTDWIGSAVYLEGNIGDRFAELESKILLQKNFGPLALVYNAIVELEWAGAHLDGEEIEFGQTLGVSYQVHPNVSVGGELLHEIDFPEWNRSNAERAHIFAGPNLTYHGKNFFATVSALWRTSATSGEPDMQTRLVVGFEF